MDANRPAVRPPVSITGGGIPATKDGKPVLWSARDTWSEANIPQRPWVVPGIALRGAVTLLAGPGSAGKSSLCVGWAVAAALALHLGPFKPPGPLKVLTFNVEDDSHEQERRLSAALRQHGAAPADVAGKIVRAGPNGVGTLLERDPVTNAVTMTPVWAALVQLIATERPDIVFLDPLAELHTCDENSNTELRLVVAHLRELAVAFNCAIVLVHHTRKGALAGELDGIRGGGSLSSAARAAFTVLPMSEDEARELCIAESQRRRFVRVDSVKGNYAPASAAHWFELDEYELDNGELVAAAVPWAPPKPQAGPVVRPETLALIIAAIGRGTEGQAWSPRFSLDQPRSVSALFATYGVEEPRDQKALLRELLKAGCKVAEYRDPHRIKRNGLRGPDGGPAVRWLDGPVQCDNDL